ncbi:uncharacterized protein LOC134461636 [Engraulis encrasicolus]|uniref:uncharacterized protein LOC134461636 n=1 Tax=Engraulis encrasicolus TaxID=184585 RepID=UPI002FD6B428
MVCAAVKAVFLMALLSLMITGGLGGRTRPASAPRSRPKDTDEKVPQRSASAPAKMTVMDTTTLAKIIQYMQDNYQLSTAHTSKGQFAAMINVPEKYCTGLFDNNFLSGEQDSQTVKQQLNEKFVYEGRNLVLAIPKDAGKKAVHSERFLLMCEANDNAKTPAQKLMSKLEGGCAVFYTYNSPCMEFCLNEKRDEESRQFVEAQKIKNARKGDTLEVPPAVEKCILNSLSVLTNHQGLKAFVFTRVYDNDIKGNTAQEIQEKKHLLAAALKLVAERVPLYKCSGTSCVKCLKENQIVGQCLSN